MYTPKDYEIVKIEIIRDNGETICVTHSGKNSIMGAVKNKFGTDMTVYQIKNSERFVISAIRGDSFREEVSINVIPTNCFWKYDFDNKEYLVWGKHSGRYDRTTFQNFIESLLRTPCQN